MRWSWPLVLAWGALVVVGNVGVADALKDNALGGLIVLLVAYAGIALVTRPRIEAELAPASRIEPRLRIVLATMLTAFSVASLAYDVVLLISPTPAFDGHRVMRGGPPLIASAAGIAAALATAVMLPRAGSPGVVVTRGVFVACGIIAVVFIFT